MTGNTTTFDSDAVTTETSAEQDSRVPDTGIRVDDTVTATFRDRLNNTKTVTGTVTYGGRDTAPSSGSLRGHRVALETEEMDYKVWTTNFGDGRHIDMHGEMHGTIEGHDATIELSE